MFFLTLVVFGLVSSSAFAACPAKPSLDNGYVCSYGSSSKTGQWAKYCCMMGEATGTCKITCTRSKWTKLDCSCPTGTDFGGDAGSNFDFGDFPGFSNGGAPSTSNGGSSSCPKEQPAIAGAFVCQSGTDSTGPWAKYCCLKGDTPTGNCKTTCKNSTWTSVDCACRVTACGLDQTPSAPYYSPRKGSQCEASYSGPPLTRCLADKCAETVAVSIPEVIDRHNCWRARVDPPAKTPLPKLEWSDELAIDAERWAAQCPNGHDTKEARTLPKMSTNGVEWDWVGQNICFASFNQTWSSCIDAWAEEQKDFIFGKGSNGKGQTGHYTQVVAERSYFVGCGAAYCPNSGMSFVQVCNYGPGGNFNGGQYTPYVKA